MERIEPPKIAAAPVSAIAASLTLPLEGPSGLLLPPFGPGRRQSHKRERLLIVALLSMQGKSANSIAKALCISPGTIRRDRQRVGYALQKAMAAAGIAAGE